MNTKQQAVLAAINNTETTTVKQLISNAALIGYNVKGKTKLDIANKLLEHAKPYKMQIAYYSMTNFVCDISWQGTALPIADDLVPIEQQVVVRHNHEVIATISNEDISDCMAGNLREHIGYFMKNEKISFQELMLNSKNPPSIFDVYFLAKNLISATQKDRGMYTVVRDICQELANETDFPDYYWCYELIRHYHHYVIDCRIDQQLYVKGIETWVWENQTKLKGMLKNEKEIIHVFPTERFLKHLKTFIKNAKQAK